MSIVRLLLDHAGPRWIWITITTLGGGVLAALVVTIANVAAATNADLSSWWRGLVFLAVVAAMYVMRRLAARQLIALFETTSAGLRERVTTSIRGAPLRAVEQLDQRLQQTTGDLAFIATTLEAWVTGIQHIAFALSITLSIVLLSGRALAVWALALGCVTVLLWVRLRKLRERLGPLSHDSAALGRQVEQLAGGFVQAKLDAKIAAGLAEDIEATTKKLYGRQNQVSDLRSRTFIGAFSLIYLLGSGVAVFVPVGLGIAESYDLLMFFELIYAPLFGIVTSLPEMARSDAAAHSLLETLAVLEESTEAHDCSEEQVEEQVEPPPFERLQLCWAQFGYEGAGETDADFRVGPVDLEIRRGDLVLVTGGNGSGKTTLMKMLLGLYPLELGGLAIDGRPFESGALDVWQQRFTTIMSPYHLFERLYGLDEIEPERVEALLARLGLSSTLSYRNGAFSNLALSTGQQMRLAMVIALLEDRPVCVFDEWTANQDPETTRWYYDTLLPELCAAGKTVIAVSHDARFFDRADHLVHLSGGQLVGERRRPRVEPARV